MVPECERILGHEHPDTFTAGTILATCYAAAGRTSEAIELGERVLADCQRILGPDHPYTLRAGDSLTISYRHAGRTSEAIELEEQVLATRVRLLDPDPATLSASGNLTETHRETRRSEETEAIEQHAERDAGLPCDEHT
jgi:hypothetical protein